MLSSGAHSIQDRKNRRAAVKRAALSSRVSLLSAVTASSSGSSGSGSTITQESVSRPRSRSSKGNGSSKGKRQRAAASGSSIKERTSPRKGRGVIDVFDFLDKDQSRASLAQKTGKVPSRVDQDGAKFSAHEESDLESDPRSFHSDSGISINDASSDQGSSKSDGAFGRRLATLKEEHVPRHESSVGSEQRHHSKLYQIPQEINEDHPERYYWTGASGTAGIDAFPRQADEPDASGYDLLASRLCSSQERAHNSLPPIYRRFERLNHRILLQLQDEIAEMEEDLQYMDRADAFERTAQHGPVVPASRRLDWQWRGSELHSRRLELLGRIYLKVEQYSMSFNNGSACSIPTNSTPDQALSSFQRVAASTSPAMAQDVHKYRAWMAENKPIVEAEATYLDKENDLLSLNRQTPNSNLTTTSSIHPTALMMTITSATALPILLFRIIPGFTSRISIILLLLPSLACIPKSHTIPSLSSFTGRELTHFLFMYFGLLILAALVI